MGNKRSLLLIVRVPKNTFTTGSEHYFHISALNDVDMEDPAG